jgi:hypothetical protein
MGVKFGDIDANQILENEFRIGVLEHVIDALTRTNPGLSLTKKEIEDIRENVANGLKRKYPNSGIEYKRAE